ncbi:hypothetical protein [Undibacterium terreum]|uniref:Uncharacterized protein n=1 Tax=Undibacterium terreum TaxID=1224302 RepID=A0A916V229_9BURK|nr:hypothetical protein [Undibacterium terreum]GGC98882.1 hypothetical protein GCM10011396_53010 [Undibacterium terreum]
MNFLKPPTYVVDFTQKTILAVLSPAALEGDEVDLDVYANKDVAQKFEAKGQRLKEDRDVFRVITALNDGTDTYDWNYTILRESADRHRKNKK